MYCMYNFHKQESKLIFITSTGSQTAVFRKCTHVRMFSLARGCKFTNMLFSMRVVVTSSTHSPA